MLSSKKFLIPLVLLVCCLQVQPSCAATRTMSGTAKVWAGVPLIGHVYVCTPYTAKYTQKTNVIRQGKRKLKSVTKTVKNVTINQKSYTSAGVALITYQHYDNWSVIHPGRTSFDVYARGHCNFVFKKIPISMGLQTFVKTISILK